MKFAVTIELELVAGVAQDAETMLDAFAATIGRENTARPPLTVTIPDRDGGDEPASVYVVALVGDDARVTA